MFLADRRPELQENYHPKNLICNFRAPDLTQYELWQRFKEWCKANGQDVCRITLDQVAVFMAAIEGSKGSSSVGSSSSPKPIVTAKGQVIVIQQQNSFVYSVEKPRREPYSVSCVKPEFQRTISSVLFDGYVENKARRLGGEFSFRDFMELKYDSFRRIVVRLKRKGVIIAHPQRSIPQIFILAENLAEDKR